MTSLDGPESRWFTRIVTDLYNVESSAFKSFALASSRSSSDFGLATGVTTGVDFPNPSPRSSIAMCFVSALPDVGSHLITRFKNDASIAVLPSEWTFAVHFPSYFENRTLSNHFFS